MAFLLNLIKRMPMFVTGIIILFSLGVTQTLKNCLISILTLVAYLVRKKKYLQTLTSLNPSKAAGCDGIGAKLLKLCAPTLASSPSVFSLRHSQPYIPAEWCMHQIKLIFKSCDRCLVQNYWPRYIPPVCFSQGIRKDSFQPNPLIHEQLNIQSPVLLHAVSFYPAPVTLTFQLNFWSSRKSLESDIMYLHFKKGLDSVAHNEILSKLWHIGIAGNASKWLLAYQTEANVAISINSNTRTALPVISGVPQGSILGPLSTLMTSLKLCWLLRSCRLPMMQNVPNPFSTFLTVCVYKMI